MPLPFQSITVLSLRLEMFLKYDKLQYQMKIHLGKMVLSLLQDFPMKFRTIILLVVILCFNSIELRADDGKINARKANELYQKSNFLEALNQYKYLVKSDEKNIEYNFRLGVCYLNTYVNKSAAIPYFKTVIDLDALDQKTDYAVAYYLLGKAYHYNNEFEVSITTLKLFLGQEGITAEDKLFAEQKIQFCYNAMELIKFPVDVTFENLGKEINSKYADYYPFIPEDESFILFNSKRSDYSSRIEDGSYSSNVYIAQVKNGSFKKAKLLDGKVNTKYYNEAVIGLSSNGEDALFFIDNEDDKYDLFQAKIEGGKARNLESLDPEMNSMNLEIAASINATGDVLYIASNRSGGYGGADIYIARKLPTGHWGKMMNLGPEINTAYDEVFPSISPDEKELFFSSEGHTSMGGLDIFRAKWDEKNKKWKAIKNMGSPINTTEDNMNFRISKTGKHGYISAARPGGYGDLDVYRVDFNDVEPRYTVITGKIYAVNTNQLIDNVFIEVMVPGSGELFDQTEELYGQYMPNSISGKYVVILPPRQYSMNIMVDGFKEVTQEIIIHDKSDYKTYIEQDLVLKPLELLEKLPHIPVED